MYLYRSRDDWSMGSYKNYIAPCKGFCFYLDIETNLASKSDLIYYRPYVDRSNYCLDQKFRARINRYLKRYVFT